MTVMKTPRTTATTLTPNNKCRFDNLEPTDFRSHDPARFFELPIIAPQPTLSGRVVSGCAILLSEKRSELTVWCFDDLTHGFGILQVDCPDTQKSDTGHLESE